MRLVSTHLKSSDRKPPAGGRQVDREKDRRRHDAGDFPEHMKAIGRRLHPQARTAGPARPRKTSTARLRRITCAVCYRACGGAREETLC